MSASEDIFFTILVRIVETRFRLGRSSWMGKHAHQQDLERLKCIETNAIGTKFVGEIYWRIHDWTAISSIWMLGEIILLWSIVNHTKTENKARILRLCFVLYYPFPSPARVMSDSRTAYGGGPVPMRYLGRKYKSRNRLRMKRSLSKTESETYVNRQKSSTTSVVWIE